jgi:hypothetical protein
MYLWYHKLSFVVAQIVAQKPAAVWLHFVFVLRRKNLRVVTSRNQSREAIVWHNSYVPACTSSIDREHQSEEHFPIGTCVRKVDTMADRMHSSPAQNWLLTLR